MIFNEKVENIFIDALLTKRILVRMKLILLLTCITVLQASPNSYAQRISLNAQGISLNEAMRHIQEQTGYRFFVNAKTKVPVTINAVLKDVPLEMAMEKILAGLPFNWTLKNKVIVINEKADPGYSNASKKYNRQETVHITGVVLDEVGNPLEGVTVS